MATAIGKTHCVTCGKDKVAYRCEGCSRTFCVNHLADHHRQLGLQLDEVEDKRNLLRQTITEQTKHPKKHPLMQEINQWEKDSIDLIQQTAEEARQSLAKHAAGNIDEIENKLAELTEELKTARDENDFNELHLDQFKQKLKELEEQLNKPSNISIQYHSSSFVSRISVVISSARLSTLNINANAKWAQNGIAVAGGKGGGDALNQVSSPFGMYVDDDQTVYVSDQCNHRVIKWKSGATSGEIVAAGNGAGKQNDQLHYPMSVVVDKKNNSLIICDRGKKRVVRWPLQNGTSGETIISHIDCYDLKMDNDGCLYALDFTKNEVRRYGTGDASGAVVAGGNGKGNRLDQFNGPYFIWVDQDRSLYVSDYGNHRVMKWVHGAKEGVVVAGGQGQGNSLAQLSGPRGVVVDQLGTIYVADLGNNRVVRWRKGATQGDVVVGGNGQGGQANQFYNPCGLSFDRQNNLYVVDYSNHRIQKFNLEPN